MISLTYISIRTSDLTDEVLDKIIADAAIFNKNQDITGQLLTCNYFIVQTIEGAENAIDDLFTRIKADPRHLSVDVLDRRPITQRQYQSWMIRNTLSITEFQRELKALNCNKYLTP